MTNSREKQLIKNTGILALGKICTQFISFFLLPLYTTYLTTKEYGVVDLLNNFISLLMPIVFFQMEQALFRFLIDARNAEKDKSVIISTAFFTVLYQTTIFTVFYIIISIFVHNEYKYFLLTNMLAATISGLLLQMCRGLGNNASYSIGSLISGVSNMILNVIFITVFHLGAYGMLIANLIANILCIVFIFFKEKVYKLLRIKNYSKDKRNELWRYSLPLIPNQLSWWVVNFSDRALITTFIDIGANGIYSAANKFSSICITFFTFFSMTWSESASLHVKDSDSGEYFSKIINSSLRLLSSLCFVVIAAMPFCFKYLVTGSDFADAYYQIPILMIATIFNITVSLLGSVYVALKKSKEIAKTSVLAAIINIVVNLIFINKIGLYAASLSTLIAYLSMSIYRYVDVQKHVKVKINIKTLLYVLLLGVIVIIPYYFQNPVLCLITLVFVLTCSILINKTLIISIFNFIKTKFLARKGDMKN